MSSASGSLGGDDSSKLDELIRAISENTDTLKALGKIIDGVQDVEDSPGVPDVKNLTPDQKSVIDNLSGTVTDVEIPGEELGKKKKSSESDKLKEIDILGLAVPISLLTSNFLDLAEASKQATSSLTSIVTGVTQDPQGNRTLERFAAPIGTVSDFSSSAASIIGGVVGSLTPLGPIIGGPIGSFVGKAIVDTLLAPINIVADTIVSINASVAQIAEDLVGFSPEVTGAIIGREIAILQDDFRRAAEIGPEIARITEAQTRLQIASRQAFDNIIRVTEPYLVAILNSLTLVVDKTQYILNFLDGFASRTIPFYNEIMTVLKGAAVGINLTVEDIAKAVGGTSDPLEINAVMNQQIGSDFFMMNPGASVQLR